MLKVLRILKCVNSLLECLTAQICKHYANCHICTSPSGLTILLFCYIVCLNGIVYKCQLIICLVYSNDVSVDVVSSFGSQFILLHVLWLSWSDLAGHKLGVFGDCKVVALSCPGLMFMLGMALGLLGAFVALCG